MDKTERALCNYKADLAEQAERYEEMVAEMKTIAKAVSTDDSLTVPERNKLSVAYKNVIGGKRSSQRILVSLLCKAEGKGDNNKMTLAKEMKEAVQNEISVVCQDILALLKDDLIPKTPENDNDAKVFYYKMLGDYYRYLAEYSEGQERKKHAEDSLVAYKSAEDSASQLPTTSPIRLGLALNFSVFYYEILDQSDKACKIAKKAFDDAIADLDSVSEDAYKDSTLIMQLLRDNLTLWTSDNDAGKEDDLVAEDVDS